MLLWKWIKWMRTRLRLCSFASGLRHFDILPVCRDNHAGAVSVHIIFSTLWRTSQLERSWLPLCMINWPFSMHYPHPFLPVSVLLLHWLSLRHPLPPLAHHLLLAHSPHCLMFDGLWLWSFFEFFESPCPGRSWQAKLWGRKVRTDWSESHAILLAFAIFASTSLPV